jgi:cytoskeletal protein CcmA (bactofilin family)
MWGQEKIEETSVSEKDGNEVTEAAAGSIAEGAGDISAFVGKGVEFKGTISYSGTVRIDGYLDGEIHTDGVLLVGEEAVIQAKITAGTIVCKGKITGDVVAKERIKLRAPAVMNGALEMAHGAREIPRDASLHPVGMIMPPGIKRVNG